MATAKKKEVVEAKEPVKKVAAKKEPIIPKAKPKTTSAEGWPWGDDGKPLKTKAKEESAPAPAPKPKTMVPGAKKLSASSRFQELIMEGELTDDAIFAKVQAEFGLSDDKRSYVQWYRKHLTKEGKNPPPAKGAK